MAAARKSHGGKGGDDDDVKAKIKALEAVVGVLGALFVVAVAAGVAYYLCMRRRRRSSEAYSEMSGVRQP